MSINMKDKYQTRSGLAVRVLATDLKTSQLKPVAAAVDHGNGHESVKLYHKDGSISYNVGQEDKLDLVPVPEYRPYKAEEAIKLLGMTVVANYADLVARITMVGISENRQLVFFLSDESEAAAEGLLKDYKWPDGKPCGKQIGHGIKEVQRDWDIKQVSTHKQDRP